MAIERLPEHLKSAKTAEAIMAPSAIVAGGAGASAAILLGAGVLPVVAVGALAYGAVVALRLPRRKKLVSATIDPMALSEPWRRYVQEAISARRRFAEVVRNAKAGPVRDRLSEISSRVESALEECWRVAKHGDALQEGVRSLELDMVRAELAGIEDRRPASPGAAASFDQMVDAKRAQLASGERLEAVALDAQQRLEVLDARLDEAVARAVELSLSAGDISDLSGLGADVDQLVGDMEALRQGLEEVRRAA